MSWDSWTDNLIAQGIDFAGIYGKDNNPWSQRNDTMSTQDVATLQQIIKDGLKSTTFGTGVTLSNKSKWAVLKVEEDAVILKGKGDDYKEWSLVGVATHQAFVVAYSKTGGGSGARDVNNKVRGLSESLKNSSY